MVSFHCDACTDIVKKPKLAHHYAQCRKSFTCIDCSKTFKDPTEWKAHTSCVTEAEKYQKSLYAGPKKGRQTNSTPKTMNAPGKYHQSSGTQSGWPRHQSTRNCASGANTTPLGSPPRMSPVDSPAVEPSLSSAKAVSTTESGEHKKQDSGAVVSHTQNGAEPKENERKRKRDREHNVKDATTDEQPGGKKVKKRKREKREEARPKQGVTNEENAAPPEPVVSPAGDDTKDEKKSKRKRKEEREEEAAAEPEPLLSQTNGAEKKRNKKDAKSGVDVVGVDQACGEQRKREDVGEKKRKKKRTDVGQIT